MDWDMFGFVFFLVLLVIHFDEAGLLKVVDK